MRTDWKTLSDWRRLGTWVYVHYERIAAVLVWQGFESDGLHLRSDDVFCA
jgi:hypothetical protein